MALLDPDRLFPAEPAGPRPRPRALRRGARPARSSARTATPIRAGMPRTSRSPIRRSCSSCPTTTSSACCSPGRAARGPRRADAPTARRSRPTARRSGGASPRTTTCSAARRRGSGSTMRFETLFGIDEPLSAADRRRALRPRSPSCLARPEFRPRALFERFNIEVIATTEGALDDLSWHQMIRDSGWKGRVVTAYRPDAVVDPGFRGLRRQSRHARRDHRLRYRHLDRLSRRAPQAPRLFKELRRDLVRPRPPDGRHRQPLARRRPRRCSTASAAARAGRARATPVPRARC